jgi:hypothetical protein
MDTAPRLCIECREEMDTDGVYPMPEWVTDDMLSDLLPVLAAAFVRNFTRTKRFHEIHTWHRHLK